MKEIPTETLLKEKRIPSNYSFNRLSLIAASLISLKKEKKVGAVTETLIKSKKRHWAAYVQENRCKGGKACMDRSCCISTFIYKAK